MDPKVDLATLRHSTSHVMAQAVKSLWPNVLLGIGPSIEDGFYYDFDKSEPFTPEDLEKIEAKMREIIKANYKFEKEELKKADAIKLFRKAGETKSLLAARIDEPGAHLDGDRDLLYMGHDIFKNLRGEVGMLEKGGPRAGSRDLAHRASEIQIENLESNRLDHGRGFSHGIRVVADELSAERLVVGDPADEREGSFIPPCEGFGGDHFREC